MVYNTAMLVDEISIYVKAGKGGDGIAHLYHDRHQPKGGPDGGDGGRGGDVIFEAVEDIMALSRLRHEKRYPAIDGQSGGPNKRSGANGPPLIIPVPVGTHVIYDNGTEIELDTIGQQKVIAAGGLGGKGNFRFRSATNQTPTEFTQGLPTEFKRLRLVLKLIADIGLIGFPNAGKSSLLNALTRAQAKVANYPFTTLEPNLGVTRSHHIIADIPGLIEGASSGRGLGYKFLKHIEKTKLLVHCLSAESPNPLVDYQVIQKELSAYSTSLGSKPQLLIITKSDLIDDTARRQLDKLLPDHTYVSILDQSSLTKLDKLLDSSLKQSLSLPAANLS